MKGLRLLNNAVKVDDMVDETRDVHEECVMKERWATLEEHMKGVEDARKSETQVILDKLQMFIATQTEINAANSALITKMMHKIYGNSQNGLATTMKLNKQVAASEVVRLEDLIDRFADKVSRLWWGVGIIMASLIAMFLKDLLGG